MFHSCTAACAPLWSPTAAKPCVTSAMTQVMGRTMRIGSSEVRMLLLLQGWFRGGGAASAGVTRLVDHVQGQRQKRQAQDLLRHAGQLCAEFAAVMGRA
jgi:hypothetical protein